MAYFHHIVAAYDIKSEPKKYFPYGYIMVTSKKPQNSRQIEAFSIIGQMLTRKQYFEMATLP